jgi:hypothetical protein
VVLQKPLQSPFQAPLQAVSLTSVTTSNRTERGSSAYDGSHFGLVKRCEGRPKRTHNPELAARRCLDPFHDPRLYFWTP